MYSYSPEKQEYARIISFHLHEGLPREGPGSTACSKKMFSFLPILPEYSAILDIGCGSGMRTIDIARLCPKARITAVDVYLPFLTCVKNALKLREYPIVSGLFRYQ
jgi:tRNA G46 methylase TrmB